MDKKFSLDDEDLAEALMNKKPYKRPEFQVFGGLHLLTQGSFDLGTDGGGQGADRCSSGSLPPC